MKAVICTKWVISKVLQVHEVSKPINPQRYSNGNNGVYFRTYAEPVAVDQIETLQHHECPYLSKIAL